MPWWSIGLTFVLMGSPANLVKFVNGNMNESSKNILKHIFFGGWTILLLWGVKLIFDLPKWTDIAIAGVILIMGIRIIWEIKKLERAEKEKNQSEDDNDDLDYL